MTDDGIRRYEVQEISLDLMDEWDANPNQMSDDQFSALVEEIAESGWLVPMQLVGPKPDGRYDIMGGHHRRRAGLVLGMTTAPAIVTPPEEFDDDKRELEGVKQNVLHGELNPVKFTQLFNRIAEKYGVEMTQRMMAFTKQDAFNRVYMDAKKALPPEMQEKLEAVRDELKTVDDLSLVLNRLFTEYGNTLDSNFMFLTWGGKSHLMVQMEVPGSWARFKKFADWCFTNGLKVDEQLMARIDWPNFRLENFTDEKVQPLQAAEVAGGVSQEKYG